MTLVANLGEVEWTPRGRRQYNADVILDHGGELIGRYREQHLWGEQYFDPGPAQAVRVRIRGVDFGVLTCNDMLYAADDAVHVKQTRHLAMLFIAQTAKDPEV